MKEKDFDLKIKCMKSLIEWLDSRNEFEHSVTLDADNADFVADIFREYLNVLLNKK